MELITTEGIPVYYHSEDLETARMIGGVVERMLTLIHESWGLDKPLDCRIFLMTSIWRFSFQSAPWLWRFMLALTFPGWGFRARRIWPFAGGLTQRYGRRVAIGIKPPRLLETSDKSFGLQMYIPESDPLLRIQQFTCHELTHACSAHLKLPAWVNEGIAMLTVDRFMGKPTIRADTLETFRKHTPEARPPGYRKLTRMKADVVIYYTLLGYWLVRYLEDTQPGLLKDIFSTHPTPKTLEGKIATQSGMTVPEFWPAIPDVLLAHFEQGV